jgi:hypothetical protein
MKSRGFVWLWILILGAVCSAAQRGVEGLKPGEEFLGIWTGTWDGAGTGGFELTLEKDKDGAIGGRVSVTGEPTYKATLKTLTFDGRKMTASYDFPPDPGGEVRLATTFEGNAAKGTWSLREKATGNEVATGGWTVTKK